MLHPRHAASRVRFVLWSIVGAALAACGGGGSDAVTPAAAAGAVAGQATVSVAAAGSAADAAAVAGAANVSGVADGTATVTAWVRLAQENDAISVPAARSIRFGDGINWVTRQVTGSASCSVGYFGSDPAWGTAKFCEMQVTVAAVTQIDGAMPVVNRDLIPGAATSFNGARVRALSSTELAAANYQPDATTIGAFREPCTYSHMSNDDPIAYPGQPGTHLHTFFGNDGTNAASTADSLAGGGSTCSGGTLNRTAYWMPTIIDTRTGQPVVSTGGNFYYKLGYQGVRAGMVQPFPKGLRIIAGDPSNTQPIYSFKARFGCMAGGAWVPAIPNCAVGDTLMAAVTFPQCWDGVNLDSPDHKSHMAYANGTGCPADHPVALPEITLNVDYKVTEANLASYWKLSSDHYSGPGGYSLHADWFGGWDAATNQAFVANCINGNLDCHDQLLGDGRILY